MAGVAQADKDIICTSGNVCGQTVRQVLMVPMIQVPIFQRRYVWEEDQWRRMLQDAMHVSWGTPHRLGRIVVVREKAPARLIVVDGQQRLTTSTLLLAACRDVAQAASVTAVVDSALLRVDGCAAFKPTFHDRAPYDNAVLKLDGPCPDPKCNVARCYAFFVRTLQRELSESPREREEAAKQLVRRVLDGFDFLFFEARHNGDLTAMYERLALREAGIHDQFAVHGEGVAMCAADLSRNLLLSYLSQDETRQIKAYQTRWLPLEKAVVDAAREAGAASPWAVFSTFFQQFVRAQHEAAKREGGGRRRVAAPVELEIDPAYKKMLSGMGYTVEQAAKRGMLPKEIKLSRSEKLAGHNLLKGHIADALAARGLAWPDPACADVAEGMLAELQSFAADGWTA